MIKKTLLIIVLTFCTTFIWFNFDFMYNGLALFSGPEPVINENENITSEGSVYSFPVSNKREDKAAVVTTVTKPFTSSFKLSIPSLGVKAPIVLEATTIESRIYSALEKGVVHYAETPNPGQPGTSIIIGHSSVYPWYNGKYGYVFSNLSKLNAGDIVKIEKGGEELTYRVSRSIIFSPSEPDDYKLRELESTDGSSIVLMTCWPNGTNAKRVAVRADLVI